MQHCSNLPLQQKRLAFVVNTMAPYRLPIYSALAKVFDTLILHGGGEANRAWKVQVAPPLRERKVWTFQIRLKKKLGTSSFFDTRYFHVNLGLLWELPNFRPDIIISNELGLRTIISMMYARLMKIDHWVWWGGTLTSERHISRPKKMYRRFLTRFIRRWISYGATSTEYLETLGALPEEILQLQNCVPHETFLQEQPLEASLLPKMPHPVLLVVGQLIARKGLTNLVEACGRLTQQGHVFSLVMVGNGPDRDQLQERAKALGFNNLYILPNQSQQVLSALYHAAQAFVFPTFEDVWGLVINEATWAGLPVLCSQYAGCAPEIVPRENVFDPMDARSFDAGLLRAVQGKLAPGDRAKLMTCSEASELMIKSVLQRTPAVTGTPLAASLASSC